MSKPQTSDIWQRGPGADRLGVGSEGPTAARMLAPSCNPRQKPSAIAKKPKIFQTPNAWKKPGGRPPGCIHPGPDGSLGARPLHPSVKFSKSQSWQKRNIRSFGLADTFLPSGMINSGFANEFSKFAISRFKTTLPLIV